MNSLYTIWLAGAAGYFLLAALTGQLRNKRGRGSAMSKRGRILCLFIGIAFAVAAALVYSHFVG